MRPLRLHGPAYWREYLLQRFQPYGLLRVLLKSSFLWSRGYRNFHDIRIVEVPVHIPRLPPAFDGYRILQLTDLHIDLAPDIVPTIRKRLSGIGYDLVVLTGDFKNLQEPASDAAVKLTLSLLTSLRPPFYATLGNHDTLDIVEPLEAGGVRFLLNESVNLHRDGATLALGGVDDSYYFETDDIERAFRGIEADQCRILLSHAPTNYREAARAGVDYMISGHTHGGQICWRKNGPLIPLGRVPSPLIAGHWKHGSMHGYTSRGTGACHVPVRYNCPGEITIHILRCPLNGAASALFEDGG